MIWLLFVSVFLASLNSVVLHKAQPKGKGSVYKYNLFCSAVWVVLLFILNKGSLHLDSSVLFFGVLYGLMQTLFILFKTLSMGSGPVSLTTLIGNCSLIISILFCFIVWNEAISIADVLGIAVLLTGIFFATYRKDNTPFSKKWKFYVVFFFVFAASVGIVFKAFSKSSSSSHTGDVMLVSAIFMLLAYSLLLLFSKKDLETSEQKTPFKKLLPYAILCGILSCLYNRFNIYLSGILDGVIFFTFFNGGVVFLSAVLSMVLLRERPNLYRMLGILLGTFGICIIGIF